MFNPIKEEIGGKKAQAVVWDTKTLNLALQGLGKGMKLVANPFYENNPKLLKSGLVFQRTPEEEKDFCLCMEDIIHFAKLCKLMTPTGIKYIKLRDYQEDYLRHLENYQLSIFLSCRQSGKCVDPLTRVKIKSRYENAKLEKLWSSYKRGDYWELPIFEIYSLYSPVHRDLYLELDRQRGAGLDDEKILLNIYNKEKDYVIEDKIVNSNFIYDNLLIETPRGYSPISYVHMTRPFTEYKIEIEGGESLYCADEHMILRPSGDWNKAQDLVVGDYIKIKNGLVKIININNNNIPICMFDVCVEDFDHAYITNSIISHNTTTSVLFMLHYILFNTDKNSLVLGNKRKTAVEILDKMKKIFLELPFFLKPGIYKWNEGEIVFDNGCRCMAEATTINSGISFTFHCVLADEFAHIKPNILEPFYNNIFPTITAGKAKFIISSTQNGYNLFHKLYTSAVAGENDYKAFKVDWWQVPEWDPETHRFIKRDDAWRDKQIANYGSEESFNKQFGTSFYTNNTSLIPAKYLGILEKNSIKFINKDLYGVKLYDKFFWHPDFNPMEQLRNNIICIPIDISEGMGGDYTVMNIFITDPNNKDKQILVGYFRSNSTMLEDYIYALIELCIKYIDLKKTIISVEWNLFGELFMKCVYNEIEKPGFPINKFNEEIFLKYYDKNKAKYINGVRLNKQNKGAACHQLQQDIIQSNIIATDKIFLNELANFGDVNGSGIYKAIYGHDDMVMSALHLEFIRESIQYENILDLVFNPNNLESSDSYNPYESFEDGENLNSRRLG